MRLFIYIISSFLFFACSESVHQPVFEKLIGVWQIEGENEFEQWTKNNDGTFSSAMFKVKDGDTTFSETVKIYKNEKSKWVFEPLVSGQNAGKSVAFAEVLLNQTQVSFENQKHDFPKYIHYSLVSPVKLEAFIAGGSDTVRFNFKRLP